MKPKFDVLARTSRFIRVEAADEEEALELATAELAEGEYIPPYVVGGEYPRVRQVSGYYVDWVHDPEHDGRVVGHGVFEASEDRIPMVAGLPEPVAEFRYQGVSSLRLAEMERDRRNAALAEQEGAA